MAETKPIIILAGIQAQGTTYALHPESKQRLKTAFPEVSQAPSVYVGYDTQDDFTRLHGPMWSQIATLLTGLSVEQLQKLGPVVLKVPATGKEFEVAA